MKKKLLAFLVMAIMCINLAGCQAITRNYGDSMTIELEPNMKLENITWKENSLWYLTRPMTESDTAVIHTFQQSSEFGVFEGTITIIETREE